jgi:heme A synthase
MAGASTSTAPILRAVPGAARRDGYATYAWVVLGVNLLVILWGAFVRASGSGAGCGSHWPLCNGEVVPRAPALETMIEFGHRLSSGLALLCIVGLVVAAWRRYPSGHRVRFAALLAALFIVSEALIGAGLVLLQHVARDTSVARAYWVGGHLTNTFLLVGALTLTAWWASGGAPLRLRQHGWLTAIFALALGSVLLLGVSGAVTALGDTLFPVATLAEGTALTFSDTAHLFVRLRRWHPALAIGVGVWLGVTALTAVRAHPAPIVRRFATALLALYAAQLGLGALNVMLLAPVGVQLAHLLLSDLIWIGAVLLAASSLAADSTPGRAQPEWRAVS